MQAVLSIIDNWQVSDNKGAVSITQKLCSILTCFNGMHDLADGPFHPLQLKHTSFPHETSC